MNARKPKLLDCTLRDGGNQNDWQFTPGQVQAIVAGLDAARVDYIEVGYRGGSGSNKSQTSGAAARCSAEFLDALPTTTHSKLAVMVVPTVCPISAMADLDRPDIDLIRIASYPWDVDRAHAYVDAAHELGARASVNLMALSYVDEQELGAIARSFVRTGPDIFYVADSFGALTTVEIAKRISILRAELPCDIGIHAHNNLGLAAANALAGLDAGAAWLDASLCSMARGAGNLATEQAAAILASHPDYTSNVDIPAILACARYVAEEVLPEPMKTGPDEIAAGLHNHHYYYLPLVAAASAEHGLDPYEVGHRLGLTMPHTVKHELVGEICKSLKLERGQ